MSEDYDFFARGEGRCPACAEKEANLIEAQSGLSRLALEKYHLEEAVKAAEARATAAEQGKVHWMAEAQRLLAKLAAAERREADWRTWGVIEVAIRNPNVASYMEHWEGRATAAEQARDANAHAAESFSRKLAAAERREAELLGDLANYENGARVASPSTPSPAPSVGETYDPELGAYLVDVMTPRPADEPTDADIQPEPRLCCTCGAIAPFPVAPGIGPFCSACGVDGPSEPVPEST